MGIARLAAAGLDLVSLYLTIKADILLILAAAAESLAHTIGS